MVEQAQYRLPWLFLKSSRQLSMQKMPLSLAIKYGNFAAYYHYLLGRHPKFSRDPCTRHLPHIGILLSYLKTQELDGFNGDSKSLPRTCSFSKIHKLHATQVGAAIAFLFTQLKTGFAQFVPRSKNHSTPQRFNSCLYAHCNFFRPASCQAAVRC
jgi:hypothetical protein